MYRCLVAVKSVTQAQHIKKLLVCDGYQCGIVRIPRELDVGSCGYAVEIDHEQMGEIVLLLKQSKMPHFKIFVSFNNQKFQEAGR